MKRITMNELTTKKNNGDIIIIKVGDKVSYFGFNTNANQMIKMLGTEKIQYIENHNYLHYWVSIGMNGHVQREYIFKKSKTYDKLFLA